MYKNQFQQSSIFAAIFKMALHNKYDKQTLRKKLENESFVRKTVSFYRYVIIENAEELRDELYQKLEDIKVLGRIYLAKEGINAQISVPEPNWDSFQRLLFSYTEFKNIPFKIAVDDNGKSFLKLKIKARLKLVADGLEDNAFDVTNVGMHLSAKEFNNAMESPDTIVVDMRNHYESEIGHFKGAIRPDSDTFRDELPMVLKELQSKKDKQILMYCTGGIRCEKASAYLRHHGFQNVNQLYGGIIQYVQEVNQNGLENKFIGKNFVFDDRLGEHITDDIIAECHQCGSPCDNHTNCNNEACHLLFIQCEKCAEKYDGCCSEDCEKFIHLPIEQQRKLRKGKKKGSVRNVYTKGRVYAKNHTYRSI